MINIGQWEKPLYYNKPRYQRLDIPKLNRDDDLTFSFGRKTDYDEVVSLLCHSGCMDATKYLDQIKTLRINNKKMDNGQVKITCLPGQSDEWVKKLSLVKGLIKCHSYTDNQVQVKFSNVHAKIDIEQDILGSFLANYRVKEYWADVDYQYGIPNGSYTFIMYNDELQAKPLDQCVYFNNEACWISYSTRVVTCFKCHKEGHMVDDCPDNEQFPALSAAPEGSTFLPGVNSLRRTRKTGAAAAVLVEGRKNSTKDDGEEKITDGEATRNVLTVVVNNEEPVAKEPVANTGNQDEKPKEQDISSSETEEDDTDTEDELAVKANTAELSLRPNGNAGRGRGRRGGRGVSLYQNNGPMMSAAVKRVNRGNEEDGETGNNPKAPRNGEQHDYFEGTLLDKDPKLNDVHMQPTG